MAHITKKKNNECGSVDYSDGITILDSKGREVVMWSSKELKEDKYSQIASEEAIGLTKRCKVNELKKMVGWKAR